MDHKGTAQNTIHLLPIKQQGLIAGLYIKTIVEIKRLSDKGENGRAKELLTKLEALSIKLKELPAENKEEIDLSIKKLQELLTKLNPSWEGEI